MHKFLKSEFKKKIFIEFENYFGAEAKIRATKVCLPSLVNRAISKWCKEGPSKERWVYIDVRYKALQIKEMRSYHYVVRINKRVNSTF